MKKPKRKPGPKPKSLSKRTIKKLEARLKG